MRRRLATLAGGISAALVALCLQQALAAQVPQEQLEGSGVVGRTIAAINYGYRSGDTKIDFRGTDLLPGARGEAKVEAKRGYLEIEVEFRGLRPARDFGTEYLTYVMWAITPEGRAQNVGEILLDRDRAKVNVTTELQAFGLIVTAEPYFAVLEPSDLVILENAIRSDTRGTIDEVQAQYELLRRGYYVTNENGDELAARLMVVDPKVPLHLYQARNAVRIARDSGVETYAPEIFEKAVNLLLEAEDRQARRRPDSNAVTTAARQAVQTAEDARVITVRRVAEERLEQERQEAAAREARAIRDAEAQAELRVEAEIALQEARRMQAEAERLSAAAEIERQAAEEQKRRAEQAAAAAANARREALEQSRIARMEADRARQELEEANLLRARAEEEWARIKERLEVQLNRVLETTNTVRGLVVNMSDVLFDTGQYALKPGTREVLARISGILSMQPDLRVEVEGHTDNVGGDEFNQRLSEQRAEAVRTYLIQQGLDPNAIESRGFGEVRPKADNASASGRQQNRRVELVVSGSVVASTADAGSIQ